MKEIFTKVMSMDEATWERHANPLSVWTRVVTGLPLMLGAVWSIKPMGYWSCAVIAPVILWIWLNPRLFSVPKQTNNWGSKVTFGERIWLNKGESNIPGHHRIWAKFLSIITGIGFLIAVVAAYQNHLLLTVFGGTVSWFGKMWFCDRMVWLYDDMKGSNPEYSGWLKE